jgi:hypothetical protein
MAASPNRSSVESRNAPHVEDLPRSRAMIPSMVSEKTKAVMTTVPQKNDPRG